MGVAVLEYATVIVKSCTHPSGACFGLRTDYPITITGWIGHAVAGVIHFRPT